MTARTTRSPTPSPSIIRRLGPSDRCPTAPVSVAVALADKIDTLVGFLRHRREADRLEDPFALRRAALGVIRLILENRLRLPLLAIVRVPRVGRIERRSERRSARLLRRSAESRICATSGVRHDLIAAVFALGNEDDLVRLLARVEALGAFLGTEDGANLLTAYRRAANIVRIEERQGRESAMPMPPNADAA